MSVAMEMELDQILAEKNEQLEAKKRKIEAEIEMAKNFVAYHEGVTEVPYTEVRFLTDFVAVEVASYKAMAQAIRLAKPQKVTRKDTGKKVEVNSHLEITVENPYTYRQNKGPQLRVEFTAHNGTRVIMHGPLSDVIVPVEFTTKRLSHGEVEIYGSPAEQTGRGGASRRIAVPLVEHSPYFGGSRKVICESHLEEVYELIMQGNI